MLFHPKTAKDWIQREFNDRRSRNPAFSLRAFARFLHVAPSRISDVLNGKRGLTAGMGEKIADRLGYSPEEKAEFIRRIIDQAPKARRVSRISLGESRVPLTDYHQLSTDAFFAISDWYHFGILDLMDTVSFVSDPKWIAKRLGISAMEVRSSLERLVRLGLVERTSGGLKKKNPNISAGIDVNSAALRSGHRQLLEKSIRSLEEVAVELRDITSITMAVDLEKMPQAKKMIRDFRRKLCAYLEAGTQTEVFALCVQLIPLSKIEGQNGGDENGKSNGEVGSTGVDHHAHGRTKPRRQRIGQRWDR